jgi:hypothetical protein
MSVRMAYDPEEARLQVWVNGRKVNQYVVREPVSTGRHISIVSRGPLSLSRFAVTKGVVAPPAKSRQPAEDKTTVFGTDGEHFSAKSIRIKDNKVEMETEYAPMRWDLDQLDEVFFAKSEIEQVDPTGNAVLRTASSKFIVKLLSMDEQKVKCESPVYGQFTVDRAAVREILLHEME